MTLVDTRTWVDFLHQRDTPATALLDALLSQERIILGDLVRYELLTGFRRDADFELVESTLAPLECQPLVTPESTRLAIGHCRTLRSRHQASPDTVSMMLASHCLIHRLPLLFSNPVFVPMVNHLGLMDRSQLD